MGKDLTQGRKGAKDENGGAMTGPKDYEEVTNELLSDAAEAGPQLPDDYWDELEPPVEEG